MPRLRSHFPICSCVLCSWPVDRSPVFPSHTARRWLRPLRFQGRFRTPSGARVANANVTLASAEKGITRTFKTDAEGNFSFSLLPADTYTLTVQAAGFKTLKQEGIYTGSRAVRARRRRIDHRLERANRGRPRAAPLLQTDNANVGDEISAKQVTELPLNLRNVFNFVDVELVRQQWSAEQPCKAAAHKAQPIRMSRSSTLVAVTLEQPHSCLDGLGTPSGVGAG